MYNLKLFITLICTLATTILFADIALPKADKQDTKYYFANVDSFSNYTFYVKKSINNKTYRLKQDAAFLMKVKDADHHLEVWAVNNADKKQTNSFELKLAKPSKQIIGNVAYIAIQFSFDKKGKLTYKETILKPDCYSNKKQAMFFITNNNSNTTTNLGLVSLSAILLLLSVWMFNNTPINKTYV